MKLIVLTREVTIKMIKGIYTAASAMVANQKKLNITSNNLANVNNTGFKKDQGLQSSFKEIILSRIEGNGQTVPLGKTGSGVALNESYTDYTQGSIRETGNDLDLAIEGSGFYMVQTPDGIRYTRDGNFALNDKGQVITSQGHLLLGERGPIQTIDGRSIDIDTSGQVYLGNIKGDRIQVVEFENPQVLEKIGDDLYLGDENLAQPANDYKVKQGYLENSNVNIVQEMVQMIQISRQYEASQKVITTIDNTLDKAVNQVARLG